MSWWDEITFNFYAAFLFLLLFLSCFPDCRPTSSMFLLFIIVNVSLLIWALSWSGTISQNPWSRRLKSEKPNRATRIVANESTGHKGIGSRCNLHPLDNRPVECQKLSFEQKWCLKSRPFDVLIYQLQGLQLCNCIKTMCKISKKRSRLRRWFSHLAFLIHCEDPNVFCLAESMMCSSSTVSRI